MASVSAPIAAPADRVSSGPAGRTLASRILLYVVLVLLAFFFIGPLLWMLSTALKPDAEWLLPNWIPRASTTKSFSGILNNPTIPVIRWFVNSMGIAAVFTFLTLAFDALAAYAYARMEFPGKNFLFGMLLATLVMPGLIFLVPNYLTVFRLHLLDQYAALVLPGLAGVFGVFFLRQFFQSIPKELEEAAKIDGANTWTTFFRVVLPLAKGALATLAVITFLGNWNDYLWPLLVMTTAQRLTLPVGLAGLQGAYTFDYGTLMAGAVIAAAPVLILYMALQRYIVAGVATTGLAGQ